ncbi:MAG: nucleotidyltransferase domain-containing protein [Candidatus Woesearchaeota archaeon]
MPNIRSLAERNTALDEDSLVSEIEEAVERIASLEGEVVAVFVGGSFVRGEMHTDSDIDTWTIVKTEGGLDALRALERPGRVRYEGFTIDEIREGKRKESSPRKSSPKRFIANLGECICVYGSLETTGLPSFTFEEDLKGRLRGWPHMLRAYENEEMDFASLAKYACWIAITQARAEGRTITKVSDLDHPAVGWSRGESGDIDELKRWVDGFMKASGDDSRSLSQYEA